MKYLLALLLLVGLETTAAVTESSAQAGRGAVSGAIIGGAVGGRRGAAIGATAGAVAGAHRRRLHSYYWRHGQCWYRSRGGRSHPRSTSVLSLNGAVGADIHFLTFFSLQGLACGSDVT